MSHTTFQFDYQCIKNTPILILNGGLKGNENTTFLLQYVFFGIKKIFFGKQLIIQKKTLYLPDFLEKNHCATQ